MYVHVTHMYAARGVMCAVSGGWSYMCVVHTVWSYMCPVQSVCDVGCVELADFV